ncbi:MAG: AlpA family phage regulatory protein [Zoogloea sp.]|nr:AlpA family phage regulatory protein [Zoogloea sp.]
MADEVHLRLPAMRKIYGGVSGATIWRWAACHKIPTPVKLSHRVTGWRVGDIRADLARRAAA